jgi:hypothetical protein
MSQVLSGQQPVPSDLEPVLRGLLGRRDAARVVAAIEEAGVVKVEVNLELHIDPAAARRLHQILFGAQISSEQRDEGDVEEG